MSYRITITKLVDNPNYEEERNVWEENDRWGRQVRMEGDGPRKQIEEKTLFTILNDEEFNAVRMAVLKEMDQKKDA